MSSLRRTGYVIGGLLLAGILCIIGGLVVGAWWLAAAGMAAVAAAGLVLWFAVRRLKGRLTALATEYAARLLGDESGKQEGPPDV